MKIIKTSTVASSLNTFCKGQLKWLSDEYEVIAVSSPGQQMKEIEEREGVRTIAVQMERHISLLKDIVSLFRMIWVFVRERPDMVHSMTPKAGLISMLAAWITRVPVRIHTFTGLVFPTSIGFKRRILMFMDRIICYCATYVNPEGNGVKRDLINHKITRKPLHVIAYGNVRGIDINWYDRTPDVIKKADKLRATGIVTFCFIGRIVADKGVNELITAFCRLNHEYKNTRLLMLGEIESHLDPVRLETLTAIERHDSIMYVGVQSDVRPYLVASDIFVFPSYREGMPNVVLEAGAMGLPTIATDINGCNEIIIPFENGELIPSKDANALYECMKDWLDNPSKVQFMAGNARRLVVERFEQQMIWNALRSVYKSLN